MVARVSSTASSHPIDEKLVAGNPPLCCGRAIWFLREDVKRCPTENQLERGSGNGGAADT